MPGRPDERNVPPCATYATLVVVGAATLAGCSVAGPSEVVDAVIRALG
jgi:hypothetical protein